MDISSFDQFIGQEVQLTEHRQERKVDEMMIGHVWYDVPSVEPTLDTIEDQAKTMGMDLRVWTPGSAGTCEFRPDRLNVHIKKDNQKFIITSFDIG